MPASFRDDRLVEAQLPPPGDQVAEVVAGQQVTEAVPNRDLRDLRQATEIARGWMRGHAVSLKEEPHECDQKELFSEDAAWIARPAGPAE